MARFDLFAGAFRLAYAHAYARFIAGLTEPRQAQDRLLAELVNGISGTDYGRHHRLARGDGYELFARKLPIVDYDEIRPWIEKQRISRHQVICPGEAVLYERTSGSSGASKDIPYTRGLRDSFSRMFLLWAYDCLSHGPRLRSASTFISVSPNLSPKPPPDGGIQIGLQDDTDYLSTSLRWLLGRFLILPRGLRQITNPVTFKRILAAHLLATPALEVISVWNPSYLSSLLEFIESNREIVAADLRAGKIEAGSQVFDFSRAMISGRRHARLLEGATLDFVELWPHLKLLSCWTDGNAALVLEPLRRRLPHALVQGKGLVATEAPMTIPLWRAQAPVPLLTEVFFEFISDDGGIFRLHELEAGGRYDIVVSQRGGLARYRIGDRVEVAGRFRETPMLRFIGRARQISDLVGEKLNENFVRDALGRHGLLTQARWMLLPSVTQDQARYVCLFEGPQSTAGLAGTIDELLQQAHHYRLARHLGQLQPVALERHERLDDAYLAWNSARGRKWGNVKPCVLIADVEHARSFLHYLQARTSQSHDSRP